LNYGNNLLNCTLAEDPLTENPKPRKNPSDFELDVFRKMRTATEVAARR